MNTPNSHEPKREEESVNFLQVGDSHCYKCHKTFPPDFGKPPHTLECKGEIKPCKDWDGKTCEFSTETPDWMEEETERFAKKFPVLVTYSLIKEDGTFIVEKMVDRFTKYWLSRMTEKIEAERERCLATYSCQIPFLIERGRKEAIQEIVICAAIRMKDGYIIRGHRHSDALRTAAGIPRYKGDSHAFGDNQGFVTSQNRYVNRIEAARIQKSAGIESKMPEGQEYLHGECYSEDLY